MDKFIAFVKKTPYLKLNLILAIFVLIFIPAKNYYLNLNIDQSSPLVRPINIQSSSTSEYPVNHTGILAPYITARSAIVVDVNSKAMLFNKNQDLKLLPASTTKIMTALIALEVFDLDDVVKIDSLVTEGQSMELEFHEEITVENLLYGLLVQSGNDAAAALANYHPQKEAGFVKAMNHKLTELNLTDTQFQNPTGLDNYGHYTTVHDLSLLAAHAMENPIFRKIVNTQNITVYNVDNTITHELETINQLLGAIKGLKGVKTGWTELAGECLVTYTKRGDKEIITVILGSLDRFQESSLLINWAFTNHQWQDLSEASHL